LHIIPASEKTFAVSSAARRKVGTWNCISSSLNQHTVEENLRVEDLKPVAIIQIDVKFNAEGKPRRRRNRKE
jgi:hypothetical protein